MKRKSNSQIKLNPTGRANEWNVMLRGQFIGTARKRINNEYVVTWNNGEESEFENIPHFEEVGPIIALSYGYS